VGVPTLIVPDVSRSFVDENSGASDLRRLLLPVGDAAAMRAGVRAAEALARLAAVTDVELVLLHVDDGRPAPEPEAVPASWRVVTRGAFGTLEDAVLAAATQLDACVVVMPTRGHDGVLDVLAGSHTERVVRRSRCPVLSVPLA
jgi:nucleotide-binding universal stress UspA family protein